MLKFRIFYGAVLIAAALFYVFFNGYLSFLAFVMALITPFISLIFTLIAYCFLSLRIKAVSPATNKDETAPFVVEIENSSILPISNVKLQLTCQNSLHTQIKNAVIYTPVSARAINPIERSVTSQYCGMLTIQLNRMVVYDYLGIFALPKKLKCKANIYVMPQTMSLDSQIDTHTNCSIETDTYSKVKSGDDPSEIFEIRDYRSGDRLRSIHWKLSSKLDKLMVKVFSLPLDNSLVLLLDLFEAPPARIDAQVEAAASVSQYLLENQITHTIEWYDAEYERFDDRVIEKTDDLALFLSRLLSASPHKGTPYALTCHNALDTNRDYSHIIYITTELFQKDLTELCSNFKNHRVSILLITESELTEEQKKDAEAFTSINAELFAVCPGKLKDSIGDLII